MTTVYTTEQDALDALVRDNFLHTLSNQEVLDVIARSIVKDSLGGFQLLFETD